MKEEPKEEVLGKRNVEEFQKDSKIKTSVTSRIKLRDDAKKIPIKTEPSSQTATKGESSNPSDPASKSKKDFSKIRCNFWPNCKKEDCPYVHPKEQVN